MNGALYISFFQGQLESALEHVVQLAVQEITKTVGASLNSMLLETAAKDQENQRLRSKLESNTNNCTALRKASLPNRGRDSKATREGTKPEQHTPSPSMECGMQADTHKLEQKGRVVGQLKAVMEHVLEFAVCELTKIVEDSFDDLFMELSKTESEHQELERQLSGERDMAEDDGTAVRESAPVEHDSDSPSSSEGTTAQEMQSEKDEAAKKVEAKDRTDAANAEADKQTVITVAQDWVPILDKVFGQKWCTDLWQIKELTSVKDDGLGLGSGSMPDMDRLIRETLEPSCPAAQRNLELEVQPQWLHDNGTRTVPPSSNPQASAVVCSVGDDPELRSPSMLHRLLTLPTQLLEGDEDSMEAAPALSETTEPAAAGDLQSAVKQEEEEEEEGMDEEEEEEKKPDRRDPAKTRGGRKSHACKQCGRKFSRAHLLKAHRQTHEEEALRCSHCGKSFSQASRLQAHLRTHVGKAS